MITVHDRKTILREDTEGLIREHYRLARLLDSEATTANRDGNGYVADRLTQQADLHLRTASTLDLLWEEI